MRLWAKRAKQKWGSVWAGDFSLSLSLVARTFWHTFGLNLKGFFTHFVVVSSRFIVNFSYFIVVLSRLFITFSHLFAVAFRFIIVLTLFFYLQKAFFRTFCLFEIFKRFICALLRPFYHFEPLQKGDPTGCKAQAAAKKSTQIKRKLTIFGYFACAQYDKISDTKSVWYGKTNRYDKFRLSPKFFRTKEKFKEFKEFANFLKNFIRGAKTTLCVAGLCYNGCI